MADPFSIGGSAVGIVSLGIIVSQGLLGYYGDWKDCDEDIGNTLSSIHALSSITLEILWSVLGGAQGAQSMTSHVEGDIQACSGAITTSNSNHHDPNHPARTCRQFGTSTYQPAFRKHLTYAWNSYWLDASIQSIQIHLKVRTQYVRRSLRLMIPVLSHG